MLCFFFNDTATTEIYTLSLHDALPICSVGLEIELNLTDPDGLPSMCNQAVLERVADADFQTELAQFNVEINVAPRRLGGKVFSELEEAVRGTLNNAEEKGRGAGAHMMLIGILPTIDTEHLNADTLSANPRYALLNEQIFAARGEDLHIDIAGPERLVSYAQTTAPGAACTSVQLQQHDDPEDFARHQNVEGAVARSRHAVRGTSPNFFG